MKTAIVYGSSTGNTESIAKQIKQHFPQADLINVADLEALSPTLAPYDRLLLGSSTWGLGDLQGDWYRFKDQLSQLNLQDKQVALFGTGDQLGYPETFCDALGILYAQLSSTGATFVGQTSAQGYQFQSSKALQNEKLVGLLLDEDNQAELSAQRLAHWCQSVGPQ